MKKSLLTTIVAAAVIVLFPTAAFANATPNAFTPIGSSWVNVPEADKVYFESSTMGTNQSVDDASFFYIPAGVTCTDRGGNAVGPFLSTDDYALSNCVDASSQPYTPVYDNSTRDNAVPFGFSINFFGTTYDSAWPNSNGGITFANPTSVYSETMPYLADSSQSSGMFAFGSDTWYSPLDSNIWTAQTTIDGHAAVVFSWEHIHNCCNSVSSGDYSYQIVLIDLGNGDFNAYFNYDSIQGTPYGYYTPEFFIDLSTVTPGSNVFHTRDAAFATSTCTAFPDYNLYGSATDSALNSALGSGGYYKLEDATAKTISLWTDSACSLGNELNANVVQDVATDGNAYVELYDQNNNDGVITAGWSTYDMATSAIDWTELLRNLDSTDLVDTGATPLNQMSLNSDIAGRFVIGQRGGQTVGGDGGGLTESPSVDLPTTTVAAAPTLAATGANALGLGAAVAALVAAGAIFFALGRRAAKR